MIKKIALGAIFLVSTIVAYNLVHRIIDTTKSGDRLSEAVDIVYKLEVKNKELKKKFTQIQSPDFIEQQARDKLNLSKAGETLVIIPEDKLKLILGANKSFEEIRLPNWQGWLKVFWH